MGWHDVLLLLLCCCAVVVLLYCAEDALAALLSINASLIQVLSLNGSVSIVSDFM